MAGGNTPNPTPSEYLNALRASAFSFFNRAQGVERGVTTPALALVRGLTFAGYTDALPEFPPPVTLVEFLTELGNSSNYTLTLSESRLIHRTMFLTRIRMGAVGLGG